MIITKEQCDNWKENKNNNPMTKRKLAKDGSTYKKIEKLCSITKEHCDIWKKDKNRDPISNRKLNTKSRIINQLISVCSTPIKSITPKIQDDLEAQRNKLIMAIQKTIAPLINKGDTTKSRVNFKNIITKYLENLEPCLKEQNSKLYLLHDNKPIVEFNKRIGSESNYGVAYMNMGKGFAKLFKFSCKMMSSNYPEHKDEVKILDKVSKLVESNKCPNMPITYKIMNCNTLCKFKDCPDVTKYNKYFVILNELANCDIQTWFKDSHDEATYQSVIMQMIFAVYAYHNMGYTHNDCHLGNFLVHKIKPGGYWRYNIDNRDVYIPNKGYLIVLWDFGMSEKHTYNWSNDYIRFLSLLNTMEQHKLYRDMKLKYLSKNFRNKCLVPMIDLLTYHYGSEKDYISLILNDISMNIINFNHIKIGGKPLDYLLNIKPYTC